MTQKSPCILSLSHELRRAIIEVRQDKTYPFTSTIECLEDTMLAAFELWDIVPSKIFNRRVKALQSRHKKKGI